MYYKENTIRAFVALYFLYYEKYEYNSGYRWGRIHRLTYCGGPSSEWLSNGNSG